MEGHGRSVPFGDHGGAGRGVAGPVDKHQPKAFPHPSWLHPLLEILYEDYA